VSGIQNAEELIDTNNKSGLITTNGAYYWFSLDSQNQILSAGVGEARKENVTYKYVFSNSDKTLFEANKAFLESLVTIEFDKTISPRRMLRDPITISVPLIVKNTDSLTMDDVAQGTYMPKANLSLMAQKLYDCIAGKNFVLDTPDFPDFTKAIEYSIKTPGLWCNQTLLNKSREFNKDKPNTAETYLRITLGQNNGESPGIPYVMEIWPPGHYSPIHNHGDSDAVIRVLHGAIQVSLFPFLCASKSGVNPFAVTTFKKDDVTWISPTLNQVHQLKNLDTNTETCITIQCYMYEENNLAHYDYFDYIDETGTQQQYEPDSDMDFVAFKALMKNEWASKPKESCMERLCKNLRIRLH
jgi:predicted metal-dependent enzyme (double-stranded beta helix superfamily)